MLVKVSEVRNASLSERPCSGSSLASGKISILDNKAICHDVDDAECPTTLCQLERTDDVIQPEASSADAVNDDVAADDDDDGPRDSVAADGAFPVKPPERTPCPPSPPSDEVRTSAEGRTCDADEHAESDNNSTTLTS